MTRFFATCVMFAGLRLGLTLSVAALFGAIAGVIAYPPMSTPYVDNHAAIVSSLLVLGIVLGIMDADKRPMWWLLAPPLAIVAFSLQAITHHFRGRVLRGSHILYRLAPGRNP